MLYFHYNVRRLGNARHKSDDVFLMTVVNSTFIAYQKPSQKPTFI